MSATPPWCPDCPDCDLHRPAASAEPKRCKHGETGPHPLNGAHFWCKGPILTLSPAPDSEVPQTFGSLADEWEAHLDDITTGQETWRKRDYELKGRILAALRSMKGADRE